MTLDAGGHRKQDFQAQYWPHPANQRVFTWRKPQQNIPVLVLSDLSASEQNDKHQAFWLRVARILKKHNASVLTLSPAAFIPESQKANSHLKITPFSDQASLKRHPHHGGFISRPINLDEVLACLSVLPVMDSGLLRKLRKKLDWGGSELESQLWNHPDIQPTPLGIRLRDLIIKAKYQDYYQQHIANTATAERLWRTVENHHRGAYQGLKTLEQFSQSVAESKSDEKILHYPQKLAASLAQSEKDSEQRARLWRQAKTWLDSLPQQLWNSEYQELGYDLSALVYEEQLKAGALPEQLPQGFEPARVLQRLSEREAQQLESWYLLQQGAGWEYSLQRQREPGELSIVPLAELDLLKDLPPFMLDESHNIRHKIDEGKAYSFNKGALTISTDSDEIRLDVISKPEWASRIYRNRHGLFTETQSEEGQIRQWQWRHDEQGTDVISTPRRGVWY